MEGMSIAAGKQRKRRAAEGKSARGAAGACAGERGPRARAHMDSAVQAIDIMKAPSWLGAATAAQCSTWMEMSDSSVLSVAERAAAPTSCRRPAMP